MKGHLWSRERLITGLSKIDIVSFYLNPDSIYNRAETEHFYAKLVVLSIANHHWVYLPKHLKNMIESKNSEKYQKIEVLGQWN